MILSTDEDFIRKIILGDKDAFDQLFRKYYSLLKNYAHKILKDISISEDIVQEIFFNLWIKREQLNKVRSIGPYLRTAVHHECISFIRKKIKNEVVDIENPGIYEFENLYADILQYQDSVISTELSVLIGKTIDNLPDHCRTVFILSRSFGFKNKEIASHLGISIKTVEKQITKALSFLREQLKDYLSLLFLFI